MRKVIIRKVFINKKNKQGTVTLPKKQLKAMDPTIKFNKDLFVELRIMKKK